VFTTSIPYGASQRPYPFKAMQKLQAEVESRLKLGIYALCNFVSIIGPDIRLLQMEIY